DFHVTGVQTCALPISAGLAGKIAVTAKTGEVGPLRVLGVQYIEQPGRQGQPRRQLPAAPQVEHVVAPVAVSVFRVGVIAAHMLRSEERRVGTEGRSRG